MTETDIQHTIKQYAETYPPLLNLDQAATIAGVSKATLYDWSSEGLLDGIKGKRAGRLRLRRDGFVRFLLTDDEPVAAVC